MSKKKASDILARMRETATREKPFQIGTESQEGEGAGGSQAEPQAPTKPPKRVRFTLDLSREQHKFLKRFALEAEADASAVVRVLLARLEHDEQLAEAVQSELSS